MADGLVHRRVQTGIARWSQQFPCFLRAMLLTSAGLLTEGCYSAVIDWSIFRRGFLETSWDEVKPRLPWVFVRLLSEKLLWYVTSIICEFLKDSLVQPHIHLRRITHFLLGTSEFGRKLLSRLEATVEAEQFEQIDY